MHPKFADFATNHKKAGTLRKTTKFDMLNADSSFHAESNGSIAVFVACIQKKL